MRRRGKARGRDCFEGFGERSKREKEGEKKKKKKRKYGVEFPDVADCGAQRVSFLLQHPRSPLAQFSIKHTRHCLFDETTTSAGMLELGDPSKRSNAAQLLWMLRQKKTRERCQVVVVVRREFPQNISRAPRALSRHLHSTYRGARWT